MTGKTGVWPVKSTIRPDIVRWPAVICSPGLYTICRTFGLLQRRLWAMESLSARSVQILHVDVLPPAESSLALFRPLVVLFDNRNALISMTITRGLWSQFCISRWRTFVFWLALHHGYCLAHAPWSYKISRWQWINAILKTELTNIILM